MVLPVLFGLATAASGAMSAIGNYQQGRAQTDAANQAAQNQYRDALKMREYKFQGEADIFRARKFDYLSGLRESELALGRGLTAIDKRAQERYGQTLFGGQQNLIQDIQARGKLAGLQPGRSAQRAMAMTVGAAGRRDALIADNLLRARYADIDTSRDLAMQANTYRRKLFSALPPAPKYGPMPSAPIMQQGPSALSLIGGLGSAALSGITAGMGMNSMMAGGGSGNIPGAGANDPLSQLNNAVSQYKI